VLLGALYTPVQDVRSSHHPFASQHSSVCFAETLGRLPQLNLKPGSWTAFATGTTRRRDSRMWLSRRLEPASPTSYTVDAGQPNPYQPHRLQRLGKTRTGILRTVQVTLSLITKQYFAQWRNATSGCVHLLAPVLHLGSLCRLRDALESYAGSFTGMCLSTQRIVAK
jgi:hypothetical protein